MYSTPITPISELPTSSNLPVVRDQLKLLNQLRNETLAAYKQVQRKIFAYASHQLLSFVTNNDLVWLDSRNLKLFYEFQKIAPCKEGLFQVIEKIEPLTYKLDLSFHWAIYNVFNITLLKQYTTTIENSTLLIPISPILKLKPQEELAVEDIIAYQLKENSAQYLVKWKNLLPTENSWGKTLGEMLQLYRITASCRSTTGIITSTNITLNNQFKNID